MQDIINKFNWEKKKEITLYEMDWIGSLTEYVSNKEYEDSTRWFTSNVITKYREIKKFNSSDYYVVETDNVWIGYIL